MAQSDPSTIEALVASKEIIVVCGPGGVGKTTVAASIAAMAACHQGGRVLVVTVDPARRLAEALGLTGPTGGHESARKGAEPGSFISQQVPPQAFRAAGASPRGELWAEMLDTKLSWDRLVSRHAPDAATARRILENPLYQNISGRFVQSHDYIAVERLYELHAEGSYDLIVVDTPPTRNALDFLLAPQRMADFFTSRLLKLLTVPYRSRFADVASRPFFNIADKVLGSQFLQDIAEFFILFQTLSDGFVARAQEVHRLLTDRRTAFVVVTTLETVPVREAESFMDLLPAQHFDLGGLVVNRALPAYLLEPALVARAERLKADAAELASRLGSVRDGGAQEVPGPEVPGPGATGPGALALGGLALLERVLREVGENFDNLAVVAKREAARLAELARPSCVVANVPEMEDDVHDLAGVIAVGRHLWS